MKNRITRFLAVSAVGILTLCVAVFLFLAFYMNRRSTETITEVGTIYMTGMNERISMHFQTTIEMRLMQVEELVQECPPQGGDEDREELAYSAKARGFNHLAACSQDGGFEMFFGSPVKVTDPEPFLESLRNNEKKIAVGTDEEGNPLILMAVPASYRMANGQESKALVAGLSVDYIKDILSLDANNTLVYSHIIRKDGSFVIRSAGAFRDTYFNRIRELFKEAQAQGAEGYVDALRSAMEDNRDYSSIINMGAEHRHMYCAKLPYSEWYLVTIMPYGTLDTTVSHLNRQWGYMAVGSCSLVLAVLLLVFLRYFQLNKQQLRALEDARREAVAANKAKSEFLSNMSHDIRTPMNAIVGMTAIASANLEDGDRVRGCLRKITMSSKHLLGLINDVLDMSKIESGKMTLSMEQVSLREVMDSIVNIVQPQVKAKNQQFEVQIYDILAENVYCDSVRLNQVLLNLLSNAIKFTPEGGKINIAMYQEESPLGEKHVRNHIVVEDTGIGMSEEFRKKVFESFVREDNARVNKTEGTGLGMAITKYIVDAMKGAIAVESEKGKGTRFHVSLDMEKAEVEEVDMILPDWNMLVVDDDQLLCESTVASLQEIGIKAEWTQDGESALEMVKQRHREHRDYQIILLDWKLPGIDGIETARRINRVLKGDIPIILISAYDWNDIEKEAKEAGIGGFISKPLFKSTLFYGLRQHMGWNEKAAEDTVNQEGQLGGYRVLLAEDNELNWEIASELLSAEGLKLDWAEDGRACVDKFARSQPGYYNAILMDIRMPVMNGYDAAKAIRELDRADKDIPIIAMTANAFSEVIKKCLESGMNAHVAKPIDIKEVTRILLKYIE